MRLISRRDTMKEMANDYDGFQQGVKEVLKAKTRKDLRGIRGAVAELVKVPANVEVAIETALGGALQNIIVETEADGREAIAFLKRRQMGRATFLPMNVIRGRSISDHESQTLKSSKGFVGIAVDLVSFDSTYTNIFSSLLGNVVVAESLEDANHIAAKAQYRYRVVTLEGDVVNPGGSMTGGSLQKKSTNLLGRQRQIEELDAEIATSEGQLSGLRSQSSSLKREITDEMLKVEQLRQLGEQQRITEQQIRAELNPLESESRTVEEQLTLDSQDRGALLEERADFSRKKVESEAALAQLQEEEASLQQAIRDAESSRKASESEKEELQSQLTDLKVKVASTSQEKQSLQDQQRRLQQDLSEVEREIEVNRGLLTQLESDMATLEQETVLQIELLNDLKLRKQQCSESIDFKRAERTDWLQKLEHGENETRTQRIQLKQVEENLHQTEVRVTRLMWSLKICSKSLRKNMSLAMSWRKYVTPFLRIFKVHRVKYVS